MFNKYQKTSIIMAIIMGIALPVAETVRRINQIMAFRDVLSWLDDYLVGVLILIFAFRAQSQLTIRFIHLIAVWGFVVGGHCLSTLIQCSSFLEGERDAGVFMSGTVLIVKVGILIYLLVGLCFSLKGISKMFTEKKI